MQNARLDEAQAGVKIAGRNINNLRYVDDTTLMAERGTKEPLEETERGSEKAGLKLNIQKTKITAFGPITSWQIDGETMETVRDIILPTKVCLVKAMVFLVVMYGCESWTIRKLSIQEMMLLNCGVGEDS